MKNKNYFHLFDTFSRKIARFRIEEKNFFKVKAKSGGAGVLSPMLEKRQQFPRQQNKIKQTTEERLGRLDQLGKEKG